MRGSSVELAKALGSGAPAEMGLEMGEEGHPQKVDLLDRKWGFE